MEIEDGTATPRSPASVQLQFRSHALIQDKPAANGGADAGPMASELLLGAVLACQHSTFVKVAAKRRTEVRIESLRGELGFENGDIVSIKVEFTLAMQVSVTDEQVQTLLRLTDKACTISQALKVPVAASFTRA